MPATPRAIELVTAAAEAAADKLADDIVAYDVTEHFAITDAFLLCSAPNDRQVKAIVDAIEDRLRTLGVKVARREGEREGRWVLLDFVEIVVHVQHSEERVFYALERLWKDSPIIPLPDTVRVGRSASADGAARHRESFNPPDFRSRRVVLWRHGRTEWNHAGRFQGQEDIDLDETGREQADRSARLLASLEPDAIVSSDLRRAQDTAAALAALVDLPVKLDPRLRETYAGEWQGLTGPEIAEQFPADYGAWRAGDPELHVGGGESRKEVADRLAAAVADAAAALGPGQLAVLVTHGGAARLGMAKLVGLPLERFTNLGGLANCSWSLLSESAHGWVLVEHNAGTLPMPVTIEEG